MNGYSLEQPETNGIAQIVKYLQEQDSDINCNCMSYCGKEIAPQYDQDYGTFIPKEYTPITNHTFCNDPAYYPENASDGSEDDDTSVMYEAYESPEKMAYCQNCSNMSYPGYCPCYSRGDHLPRYIDTSTPSTPEMEEDSNDSIERRLPSIAIFQRDAHEIISSLDPSPTQNETGKRKRGAKNILLWKFLLAELNAPNTPCIKWVNKAEGTFRFMDTVEVSRRWGQKKQKADMNFEKLSRGIRHYYKNKFMTRIDGVRLVYKFNWSKIPKEMRPYGVL